MVVKDLMDVAKERFKTKSSVRGHIDSRIFRLHYQLNTLLLMAFTLIAAFQLFGNPINCTVDPAMDEKIMNTYCWITSTYTLPSRLGDRIGTAVVAPGVGSNRVADEPTRYHTYYQWTVFFMLFQVILFSIPHYIWEHLENGRLAMLRCYNHPDDPGNPKKVIKTSKEEFLIKVNSSTNFLSMKDKANNDHYFYTYIICEALNLVNVMGQIFFIDRFLSYEFTKYGTQVLNFISQDSSTRTDPMDRIFPKVTKCVFRRFGPSGNIVNYDGLCVLPLNIVYEKLFIFLWFWYVMLALITGIGLIYRLCTLFSHVCRKRLILSQFLRTSGANKLSYNDEKSAVKTIMDRFTPGDWFILYQLSKTFEPCGDFQIYVIELAKKFGWKEEKVE